MFTKHGADHLPDGVLAIANPCPSKPPANTPALHELRKTKHFELACEQPNTKIKDIYETALKKFDLNKI